jgi:peptidoglycan/LPS O-acetylase OafA/YrhL
MNNTHINLSHIKYRPDIDGLRAIAVLSVVAFHLWPKSMKAGFIGVDIFFVISGYLISTIIFTTLNNGTFSFSDFYKRRIKRIFPSLIIVLSVCFIAGRVLLLTDELKQLGKHLAAGAGFISNFILWNEAGYFDNSANTKPLLHLWSLGIEEQFYLFWPLLLWLCWKRKFNLLLITLTTTTVSLYLNLRGIKIDNIATFYSPETRFWELMFGSLLAWITLFKSPAPKLNGEAKFCLRGKSLSVDIDRLLMSLISFTGITLLIYGFLHISKDVDFPGKWAIIPALATTLIIYAGPNAWPNRKLLANKVLV